MAEARPTAGQKNLVAERAANLCEYCRSPVRYATDEFCLEHTEPRRYGGKTVLDNLAFSCQGCNSHKYTKTQAHDPITGEIVPLYNREKIGGGIILPGATMLP
ncbi:MAG: HNH endonuclease [Chloroflexia bacterium]